jgi:phosphonate metabolism protein PhnN/1,5-bisphosphokinase (PRPP-forming)
MADRPGRLILVVGPSGAGKDSIIRGAQRTFSNDSTVVFPRRVVTRDVNATAEDHDSVPQDAFEQAAASGRFAVWWKAHGNGYGIPRSIDTDIAEGRSVVFNCSRDAIADVMSRYTKVTVVDIRVSPEVLVDRIVARGRETRAEAEQRVARKVSAFPPNASIRAVQNDGNITDAIATFCTIVKMSDDA